MSAAAEHIETMRAMLKMPSRDESLWQNISLNQKRGLLTMAGLPGSWAVRHWGSFTQRERIRLLTQVHDASTWAARLRGPE